MSYRGKEFLSRLLFIYLCYLPCTNALNHEKPKEPRVSVEPHKDDIQQAMNLLMPLSSGQSKLSSEQKAEQLIVVLCLLAGRSSEIHECSRVGRHFFGLDDSTSFGDSGKGSFADVVSQCAHGTCGNALIQASEVLKQRRRNASGAVCLRQALSIVREQMGKGAALHVVFAEVSRLLAIHLKYLSLHKEALDILDEAVTVLGRGPSQPQLASMKGTLILNAADHHNCMGSTDEAHRAVVDAERLMRSMLKKDPEKRLLVHKTLVTYAQWNGVASHKLLPLLQQGVKDGLWPSISQRPMNYKKGIIARAWHTQEQYQHYFGGHFAAFVQILRQVAPMLRQEVVDASSKGLFQRQRECLDARSEEAGEWVWLPVVEEWQRRARQCYDSTPVGCALVARLDREVPAVRLRRIGYSTVYPNSHIRPHTGISNSELRLHLGLEIPAGALETGEPCVSLMLDGVERQWLLDDVIVFDDTFVHSVHNNCTARRTIMQVVVNMPQELYEQRRGRTEL